jgi:ubiquinone/menaquinone biosynthesis C-methylase UbiE
LTIDSQIDALHRARIDSWGKVNLYRLRAVLRYAGNSILDVGCSTGSYVVYLNDNGYKAYGLDLLADAAWLRGNERRYTNGSARELPFPNQTFDTVAAFELLEHIPEPDVVLAGFHRVCRQNVILTVPDCETPVDILRAGMTYAHWRDRTHCNFFTQESLRNALEQAGFEVASITQINPILPDFLILRSFHIPFGLAYFASRVLRRIPFKRQYFMTLLAIANKL